MKRKLTLFLSAVMAVSSLPMTAYAANFKDINEVAWAASTINSVVDRGLLSGYDDNTFRGKKDVTYPEAMQMVYNVLMKTNMAKPIDAVKIYSYMTVLDSYQIPKWSQMAVAYGLYHNVIDLQMVVTKFAGNTQSATREDVAKMFGNALGHIYGLDINAKEAKTFADSWSISSDALSQVDLLKRLGIMNGDAYGRLNPKKNINRAEMAVMLNKTYDIMQTGVNDSGVITELLVNEGKYYMVEVSLDRGGKESFNFTEGDIPAYVGDTSETMPLSKLSEGDQIVVVYNGKDIKEIRVTKAISSQAKYDITGYVVSVKNGTLSLENENTGETDKYPFAHHDVECYVEGERVQSKELDDVLKEHVKKHAYAGAYLKVEREKVNGNYKDVLYIQKLYITLVDEYTATGLVNSLKDSIINLKLSGSSVETGYQFAKDVTFYIGDRKVSLSEAKEMANDGTVYAKVTVDGSNKASKIILAEDTFVEGTLAPESKTYTLKNLSDKKMIVKSGGNETIYTFGTENPLNNIVFYEWIPNGGGSGGEWEPLDDVNDAESRVNSWDNTYCRVTFNSGNKISEVYLTDNKSAWRNSDEHQTERKGTVASAVDDVLKFVNANTEYKLRMKYDSSDLNIKSAKTGSKAMFVRMANDSSLKLYAEIEANGDNEVIRITEAKLTEAKGKLVEFDPSNKLIEIETKDGNTFKLNSQRNPLLTDEDEDDFNLKDIESSRYVGEEIELGFNSNGSVNRITVVNGPKSNDATARVKGIATLADNGYLKVNGKTYAWAQSVKEPVTIENHSGPLTDFYAIKDMLADENLKVYIEAELDDKDKVCSIKVFVRKAEGMIVSKTKETNYLRLETETGEYSFVMAAKVAVDLIDFDKEDIKEGRNGYPNAVEVTFDDAGRVTKITEK